MPRRGPRQPKAPTKLAAWRSKRGLTQLELARATGLAPATYIRLEQGRTPNPPVRYLINCATALGCRLDDLIEDEWKPWTVFDRAAPEPPDPERFWRARQGQRRDSFGG